MESKSYKELTVEFLGKMSEEIIRIDEEVQNITKDIEAHSEDINNLKEFDIILETRIERLEAAKFM